MDPEWPVWPIEVNVLGVIVSVATTHHFPNSSWDMFLSIHVEEALHGEPLRLWAGIYRPGLTGTVISTAGVCLCESCNQSESSVIKLARPWRFSFFLNPLSEIPVVRMLIALASLYRGWFSPNPVNALYFTRPPYCSLLKGPQWTLPV